MIEVKTQAEFDAVVSNTSATQMTRIYPKTGGGAYTLGVEWTLPNGAFIQGVHHPKIEFTGTVAAASTKAMLKTALASKRITIRGLQLVGKPVSGSLLGIQATDSGDSLLSGATTGTYSRYTTGTTGVQNTAPGLVVEQCVISGTYIGIALNDVHYFRIARNRLRDNLHRGLELLNCRAGLVTANESKSDDYVGIYAEQCEYVAFSGNQVQEAGLTAISAWSNAHLTFRNNHVRNNADDGIRIEDSKYVALSGNIVMGNGGDGIYLKTCQSSAASGNVSTGNGQAGVRGNATDRSAFGGNMLRGNQRGANIEAGSGNAVTGNMMRFNTLEGLYLSSGNSVGVGNNAASNSPNHAVSGTGTSVPSSHNDY